MFVIFLIIVFEMFIYFEIYSLNVEKISPNLLIINCQDRKYINNKDWIINIEYVLDNKTINVEGLCDKTIINNNNFCAYNFEQKKCINYNDSIITNDIIVLIIYYECIFCIIIVYILKKYRKTNGKNDNIITTTILLIFVIIKLIMNLLVFLFIVNIIDKLLFKINNEIYDCFFECISVCGFFGNINNKIFYSQYVPLYDDGYNYNTKFRCIQYNDIFIEKNICLKIVSTLSIILIKELISYVISLIGVLFLIRINYTLKKQNLLCVNNRYI